MLNLLQADAQNRAWRTFLVSLIIDVGVAITLLLVTTFQDANSWGEIEWTILGFSLAKTVVASAGSFILRRYVDASRIPTPLPPSPVPQPADPA
jgi:hypothetical protein